MVGGVRSLVIVRWLVVVYAAWLLVPAAASADESSATSLVNPVRTEGDQMTLLRDIIRENDPTAYVHTMQLAGGDRQFAHANVSPAALDAYHQAEQDLVAPLVTGTFTDAPGVPPREPA
jgi:hypothetical protein